MYLYIYIHLHYIATDTHVSQRCGNPSKNHRRGRGRHGGCEDGRGGLGRHLAELRIQGSGAAGTSWDLLGPALEMAEKTMIQP